MNFDYIPFLSLLENIVDNRGKTCPTSDSGIPLIATNCVLNSHLYPVFEKIRYVDSETYKTWFRDHPKSGDMLFVTKGTPGRICWVPKPVNFCIAQDMVAIRANEKLVYPKFLFALLRSSAVQKMIENMHVGTLIPHFKKGDFDKLKLPIPTDYNFQKKIGNLYFDISEKIEINRQMNATLEAIAQSVFREWFVDGEDIDNWEVGKLGDIAKNIRRSVQPSEIEPDTPYIGLEHMPRKSIALSEWDTANDVVSNKYLFKQDEFLFGKLRPYFHKVGVAPLDGVSSTDILVVVPKEDDYYGVVLGHISSVDLINHTTVASTGTKMPRTNWSDIARYEIALPPKERAKQFSGFMKSVVQFIQSNIMESRTLANIRDTLLPKLMNGKIEVSDD